MNNNFLDELHIKEIRERCKLLKCLLLLDSYESVTNALKDLVEMYDNEIKYYNKGKR